MLFSLNIELISSFPAKSDSTVKILLNYRVLRKKTWLFVRGSCFDGTGIAHIASIHRRPITFIKIIPIDFTKAKLGTTIRILLKYRVLRKKNVALCAWKLF